MSFLKTDRFGNPYALYNLDYRIFQGQIDIVSRQLFELKSHLHSEQAKIFFSHFASLDCDGCGSLKIYFYDSIWDLNEDNLAKVEDAIEEVMCETKWLENFQTMRSIEEEIDYIDSEEIISNNLIKSYMDSKRECGYKITEEGVFDLFSTKVSQSYIDNEILIDKIKNSSKWVD